MGLASSFDNKAMDTSSRECMGGTWTSVDRQCWHEVADGGRATTASPCARPHALAGTRGYSAPGG
jgi:hypothetical protein